MAKQVKALDMASLEAIFGQPCASGSVAAMARWREASALLSDAAWDRASGQWMARAEELVGASCADADRVWPHAWVKRKAPLAAQRLARHLELGEQSAATHAAMMGRLAQLSAEEMPPLTVLTIKMGKVVAKRAPEGDLSEADAAALVGALAHAPLREVRLRGTTRAMWEALAGSALPGRLERVVLELGVHAALSVDEELELAARLLEACGPLKEVALRWGAWRGAPRYGARLWAALLRHAPTLEVVALRDVDDAAQASALGEASWPALRRLTLSGSASLGAGEVEGLLRRAPALEALSVHGIGPQVGEASGEASGVLEALEVTYGARSGEGLVWLLGRPAMAGLRRLKLAHVPGVAGLWEAVCGLVRLEELEVEHGATSSGEGLIDALLARPLVGLRRLRLSCDDLDKLAALKLPALERLGARCVAFEEAKMERLAASALAAQLGGALYVGLPYAAVAATAYKDRDELKRFLPLVRAGIG